jgi:hypothetical protein
VNLRLCVLRGIHVNLANIPGELGIHVNFLFEMGIDEDSDGRIRVWVHEIVLYVNETIRRCAGEAGRGEVELGLLGQILVTHR